MIQSASARTRLHTYGASAIALAIAAHATPAAAQFAGVVSETRDAEHVEIALENDEPISGSRGAPPVAAPFERRFAYLVAVGGRGVALSIDGSSNVSITNSGALSVIQAGLGFVDKA